MTDLNHVVLIGRLTRDLGDDERSFGYVGNGQARANVSIAVNRSKKSGDEWVETVSGLMKHHILILQSGERLQKI